MFTNQDLIKKFFDENGFIQSNINTYNNFVKNKISKVVEEAKDSAVPAVIPPNVEEVKFVFGDIQIKSPVITEADGSERQLFPSEARLRNLTYSAPVVLEISLEIDGKERDRAEVPIINIPVMLKSDICRLNGLSREELIEAGEDPDDTGGYFIVNGTERVLTLLEDLAPNRIFVKKEKIGAVTHSARVFSSSESYKIPHLVERSKDGLFLVTFSSFSRSPFVVVAKALGLNEKEIVDSIGLSNIDEDMYINLYDFREIKKPSEAQEFLAKSLHMGVTKERKIERINHILDNLLLPHIGKDKKYRLAKAQLLGRMIKKIFLLRKGEIREDDKDHYSNKRIRLSGDMLEDLWRTNFKVLVNDILYIFQRGVRRGRITPLTALVRTNFVTSRMNSAMATGNWSAKRQGVSQRLERDNPIAALSQLRTVTSQLESTRESFEARQLHPTHWGRMCPIESPEGKNIGLRKTLSLMASITTEVELEEKKQVTKTIKILGVKELEPDSVDVFFDGVLIGSVDDGKKFVSDVISSRRSNKISRLINVSFDENEETVHLTLDKNRVRRPLIIVNGGKSNLDKKHSVLSWSQLIEQGVIEELDALEEEGALVALSESDITKKHTHLEINPISIFGVNTSLVPYGNFNQSSRLLRGQKTQKQGAGYYATNFLTRLDTNTNLLHYPQTPIVRSFMQDIAGDYAVGGQNVVVALLNYEGYNMLDGIVINKASIDRGFGRSTYYRPYSTEKLRYPGGQVDEILIPDKDIQGYTLESDYIYLDKDGLIQPEINVKGGDVLIGKTSPPRFLSKLESFNIASNIRKDTSVRVKFSETGIVSNVFLTESESGVPLINAVIRDSRIPEVGDKLASRHGQKGVVGYIVGTEDVPFTASGIQPDLIASPFGMRRMTVGHLMETLGAKVGALDGRYVDATTFHGEEITDLRKTLLKLGFREDGTETMYDGRSGRSYKAKIFIGNLFYMRLKHQVKDKLQFRARGRVALLTRQPTAGKAMEGGLRFGEMEKETLVAHGASLLMKERFDSDKVEVYVCEKCGGIAAFNYFKNKPDCISCEEKAEVHRIEISYAFKLFLEELKSMGIKPKLILKDKFRS